MTATPANTVRVGVLAPGTTLRRWQSETLNHLLGLDGVELGMVVVDARRANEGQRSDRLVQTLRRGNRVWRAYLNRWVTRRSEALGAADERERFAAVPIRPVVVERRGRWSEHFAAEDLAAVRDHGIDVLLRFGFGIVRGGILDVAPLGVWSFHHGDIERYRGSAPCFWELYEGEPVVGATLQRLTERLDGGVILRQGWFRAVTHSYVRTTDAVHLGAAPWPAEVCRDVLAGRSTPLDGSPTASTARLRRNPGGRHMARFFARLSTDFVRSQARELLHADQWNVGVVNAPIERFADPTFWPEARWAPAPSTRHVYRADPFGTDRGGDVLVEEFDHRRGRGAIVALDVVRGTVRGTDINAVEHMSYPYVFENREVLCIPQVAAARSIRAHACQSWPHAWGPGIDVVSGVMAADPTLVAYDGRYWLFFTDKGAGANSHLCVWWADDLAGPWRPHARNPVKVDVRSARPAGTPFVVEGVLHRPAQDCSRRYGGAVVINAVRLLTPESFFEEPVARHDPAAGAWGHGMHTLSQWGADRTLVDGRRYVFSWPATRREVAARLRRR